MFSRPKSQALVSRMISSSGFGAPHLQQCFQLLDMPMSFSRKVSSCIRTEHQNLDSPAPGSTTTKDRIDKWLGQTWQRRNGINSDPDENSTKKSHESGKQPKLGPDSPEKKLLKWLLLVGGPLYLLELASEMRKEKNTLKINWKQFEDDYLKHDLVESIDISNPRIGEVKVKKDETNFHQNHPKHVKLSFIDEKELKSDLRKSEAKFGLQNEVPITNFPQQNVASNLKSILATIYFYVVIGTIATYFFRRRLSTPDSVGANFTSVNRSKSKQNVTFKDVAGCEEVKFEIKEFVDFLTNPDKYKKLGAKIPSGVLLSGPPGSGKTLLARATAGESKVPFYQVKGSEFMQMFVGVGSMKIRSLFAKARATAPSIVFIDEIDAVGRKRSSSDLGTQREYDNTLNQLLVEMDGFHEASRERAPVVVFAATNLPGVLDPALKRSGRFDRHIMIPLPDKIGRREIFGVHMTPIKIDEHEKSQIASEMAERTPGMSGADIENICNESAIFAARDNSPWVQMTHFEKAFERVICGLERKTLRLDPKELEIVAYHEAGHAIVGHFMDRVDPLIKISLIPRGKGLGYTQYKTTDKHLSSREALFQLICNLLGGRVAEMIKFNDFTSGAADDLQKVNRLAYSYVTTYGMSDELGPVSYNVNSYEQRLSESMLSKIDEEVNKLIKQAQETTRNLLLSKLDLLEEVAQTLRKKEVMNYNDFIQIVNR